MLYITRSFVLRHNGRMMSCVRPFFLALALLGSGPCWSPAAWAAPDEIQVYNDDIHKPGEAGLELHLNHVPSGRKAPSYAGEMRSDHRFQATMEWSYGWTSTWEAGLYVPVARDVSGSWVGNGLRARLKYIAPEAEGSSWRWGVNAEVGVSARRVSESPRGLEVRPIVAWENAQWALAFNPILAVDLASGASRRPAFEPAIKVARKLAQEQAVGLEAYADWGPWGQWDPAGRRPMALFATWDGQWRGVEMNLGVGRGLQGYEDRWVVKAILGWTLGASH